VKAWGKVRTELVKRIAREVVERFPDKFTTDFENNKKLVDTFTNISSKKLRNKVACMQNVKNVNARANPKAVSILIRAGLERMVDEAERVMHDALSVVADVFEKNKIVVGGGAAEIEAAKQLREYAVQIGGREQLAVEAFAESLEIIPKTLAENAGLEQIDIMVELRSAHEKLKGHLMGVDVFTGKVVNLYEKGVIEPLSVKEQAINSASEASFMILRIDDVISGGKTKAPPTPPGGPS
jgi:chaperonin GroEL (HSP60 family)